MARRSREQFSAVADVGDIPAVVDPDRREFCRLDLHRFLTTYFPLSTGRKPFSEKHKRAIGRLQQCILEGGLFEQVFPRGYAKTTIAENGSIWAILYGHRKFVPIFGADANAASGNIDSIKLELAENDLLYEDFPEVCHPIRALEGKPQRCASQTHDGELTHIEWRADTIVMPTIAGSVASGGIITARGLMGGSRGMKHKRPDGTQQRPDFVLLDDPQTDESAASPLQVRKRLDVIRKNILKLGGHDRRIAVCCNATIIRPDDVAEQLLDPKRFPAWQGERIRMVNAWAGGRPVDEAKAKDWKGLDTHERMWLGDYARLRNTFDPETLGDQQRAHREATEFYRRNRPTMDAGCEVTWEHCYDPDTEVSAVQHAYNLLIDDGPEVFASECQNDPLKPEEQTTEGPKPDQIAAKVNRLPRGTLPLEGSRLVAFIDPKKDLLYWTAAAFGDGFTGAVVDYGTYPDQRRSYFAARDARVTLAKATGKARLDEQLYAGLDMLVTQLMAREWRREGDGAALRFEKILIDANWGDATDTVYLFCRRSPHAAILLPTHGRFYGAKTRPMNDSPPKQGERRGWSWYSDVCPQRKQRRAFIDVNAWKTRMHSLMGVPMGGAGCISLFGDQPEAHKMFADHLAAEFPVRVTANNRSVTEWQVKPHRPDNDFLDCLVGCGVAASMLGVDIVDGGGAGARRVRRVKLSELQRLKAGR